MRHLRSDITCTKQLEFLFGRGMLFWTELVKADQSISSNAFQLCTSRTVSANSSDKILLQEDYQLLLMSVSGPCDESLHYLLQVFQIKEEFEDKSLQYPVYYLKPFHAYTNGNLDWTAAFENESATSAMAWRVYKDPTMTAAEAQDKMRASIFECLEVSFNPWMMQTANCLSQYLGLEICQQLLLLYWQTGQAQAAMAIDKQIASPISVAQALCAVSGLMNALGIALSRGNYVNSSHFHPAELFAAAQLNKHGRHTRCRVFGWRQLKAAC